MDTKGEALAFKVMRLNRPNFYAPLHSASTMAIADPDALSAQSAAGPALPLSLSDVLLFPPGFGNIYLGETFAAFICVSNSSHFALTRPPF